MSVKSRFLEKLQTRQSALASSVSKSQTDIAEFRLRMTQLQEQMDAWLEGTGLNVETVSTSVTDLLVEGRVFDIATPVPSYQRPVCKICAGIFLWPGCNRVRGGDLP
jgi:Na+-translocating ferredoxin:NAD+ oxidoreductase RnfD subunit